MCSAGHHRGTHDGWLWRHLDFIANLHVVPCWTCFEVLALLPVMQRYGPPCLAVNGLACGQGIVRGMSQRLHGRQMNTPTPQRSSSTTRPSSVSLRTTPGRSPRSQRAQGVLKKMRVRRRRNRLLECVDACDMQTCSKLGLLPYVGLPVTAAQPDHMLLCTSYCQPVHLFPEELTVPW